MTHRLVGSVVVLLLLAAATSCTRAIASGDDIGSEPPAIEPQGGGQSGGEGQFACVDEFQPLETAVSDGKNVSELMGKLESALQAGPHLQWWPRIREPERILPTRLKLVELTVDESVKVGCNKAEGLIALRVRSEDAALDARFAGDFTLDSINEEIKVSAKLVEGGLADGPARAGLAADATLSLELNWSKSELTGTIGVLDGGAPVGYIGQPGRAAWEPTQDTGRQPLALSELQRRVCASMTPTSRVTFDSQETLRQSLVKRWVVCSGTARVDPAFAGFEVHADGRWHELRVDGDALVAAQGFGHEGVFARVEFRGGGFNLAILDWLPWGYQFANAELSADGNTLRIQAQQTDSELDATFQATDLAVRYPPQPYEPGARVGLAACDAHERDVTSRFGSQRELTALMAGRWRFCRGGLGTDYAGIEFSTDGTRYYFLDAGGARVASGMVWIIDTSSMNGMGFFQVNVETGINQVLALTPIFASTPLKMLARDDFESVLGGF